jgi:cytochrome bd-type quinol oxidase subunit 1
MFDLEEKVGAAVKMTVCMTALAVAVVAAGFFLCLALFIWTQQQYGAVTASLVLAILFVVIAIAAAVAGWVVRQRTEQRQHQSLRRAARWWSDPMVITAALQVFRTIGSRQLIPVLVGAFVVGALLDRPSDRHPRAEL